MCPDREPSEETPCFPGPTLLRGFCKVVNLCGPTEFHCGSWLGQNPEGWPQASWSRGGSATEPLGEPCPQIPMVIPGLDTQSLLLLVILTVLKVASTGSLPFWK